MLQCLWIIKTVFSISGLCISVLDCFMHVVRTASFCWWLICIRIITINNLNISLVCHMHAWLSIRNCPKYIMRLRTQMNNPERACIASQTWSTSFFKDSNLCRHVAIKHIRQKAISHSWGTVLDEQNQSSSHVQRPGLCWTISLGSKSQLRELCFSTFSVSLGAQLRLCNKNNTWCRAVLSKVNVAIEERNDDVLFDPSGFHHVLWDSVM